MAKRSQFFWNSFGVVEPINTQDDAASTESLSDLCGPVGHLGLRGERRLTVLCPGFAADCLETLEEIALTGRAIFMAAGGESFHYVPALNAREDHARALAQLILRSSSDWT